MEQVLRSIQDGDTAVEDAGESAAAAAEALRQQEELHKLDQSREAVRRRCKRLFNFMREAWHVLEPRTPYLEGWATAAIALHLEAVTAGSINRLLVTVPPGMMKSLLVSVFWPAWEWGPMGLPHLRYGATSYEEELVMRDNDRMRKLVKSDWYQEHWGDVCRIPRGEDARHRFANTETGWREGRAFESMTGIRGDRIIIDDPHSIKGAESEVKRPGQVRTFREAISDRLNNDRSAMVMIMQRVHADDCAAAAMEFGYVHLNLPMEFEADQRCATQLGDYRFVDPRREDGELLFPERFNAAYAEAKKREKGSYSWSGQYQQRPTAREGGMFKRAWFGYAGAVPAGATYVRRWDLAATETGQGRDPDWTAGVLMARCRQGFYYVVDVVHERLSAAGVERLMTFTAESDARNYGPFVRIGIPQDPGQAGKAQAGHLTRLLAGYNVSTTPETGSKIVRASALEAQAEAGNIKLLHGPWNKDYLDEMTSFPGRHDDQVDATAGAFHLLTQPTSQGWLDYYAEQAAAVGGR